MLLVPLFAGNCNRSNLAYGFPSLSEEISAGDPACSSPKGIFGSEGLESKKSPSSEKSSNTGSVQKVGRKKVAGPLKLVVFKNNVQH